jgi:hypothetical protein
MIDPKELGSNVAKQILEVTDNTKKVVVYSGRFQPFHPGHYGVYQHLVKTFGKDNVFIGTSNKVDKPKSPLNFKEKVEVMTKMFRVPKNKIVQIKNPYAPTEILKKFGEDTVFITVVGQKDASRLGGNYFDKYDKSKDLLGYKDKGYIYIAPPMAGSVSGTEVRQKLGDPSLSTDIKQLNFKKIYGKLDNKIFDLITDRLTESVVLDWVVKKGGKLFEGSTSNIGPDDGPGFMLKNFEAHKSLQKSRLTNFLETGWNIVKYLLDDELEQKLNYPEYPNGPVDSVSYFPAGDLGVTTPNNQQDIYGTQAYDKWKKHILRSVELLGWEWVMSKGNEKDQRKDSGDDAKDIEGEINESYDRTEYLKNYYRNLTPDYQTVEVEDGKVIIDTIKTLPLSKGIQREDMPQVRRKDMEDYIDFLRDKEITVFPLSVKVSELKNTQTQLNRSHIQKFIDDPEKIKTKPVIISKDYYILDGHHRANALFNTNSSSDIDVLQVGLSIDNLIDVTKEFDKVEYQNITEQILIEGGAYGHMRHPFEDMDLTFNDIKRMIELGLQGKLDIESGVTEKTDGQALSISYRDDRGLIAARNKSHLKDSGINALDVNGVKQMFKGRGELEKAFSFAIDDLDKAISKLSDKQTEKIFGNGTKFMALEVIYPATQNVVPYGLNLLVFHGSMEYDETGSPIGEDKESGRILSGMIKQINQDVQNTYKIQGPPIVKLPQSKDFSKSKQKYFGRLKRLQNEFRLKDNDEVSMYHQMWWEKFIRQNAKKYKYPIPNHVLIGLVKRWAFFDKSYAIRNLKKDVRDEKFLDWVTKYDKQNHANQVKENMRPFESLFLELGAEILQNVSDLLTANPEDAVQKLRKDVLDTVKQLRQTNDVTKIKQLQTQLKQIESAGGLDKLVPTEGIVFQYKGKTYKLTGLFAPINQLLGSLKYG